MVASLSEGRTQDKQEQRLKEAVRERESERKKSRGDSSRQRKETELPLVSRAPEKLDPLLVLFRGVKKLGAQGHDQVYEDDREHEGHGGCRGQKLMQQTNNRKGGVKN
jgi:hypothetical protein